MHKKDDKKTQVDKNADLIKELENNWKRALADYKNLEKRTSEEKSKTVEFANCLLVENLLPVLDSFEMLEKHNDDMGLKFTIREFRQVLQNNGLKKLEINLNDSFDHNIMDAVETIPGPKNRVIEIVRNGYNFRSKLIRPVSVKVGNGEVAETSKE